MKENEKDGGADKILDRSWEKEIMVSYNDQS